MKKRRTKQPRVKKVVLPAGGIVRVAVPPGVLPVVAIDPIKRVVEIVPVKDEKTWWQKVFG